MAVKTVQCGQAGCTNTFTFDDQDGKVSEEAAATGVGGWTKTDGVWKGCPGGAPCSMVPAESPPPAPKKRLGLEVK